MLPLFLLFGICLAHPKIIYLNDIATGNATYHSGIKANSNLYIASSDNVELLKNITIIIGEEITLDKLLNRKNADGSEQPWIIGKTLGLKTTNSMEAQQNLTGFLYITTPKQAADEDFSVFVISDSINITRSSNLSTTVILNTFYGLTDYWYSPFKTSYVSNIVQDKSARIYLHSDYPSDDYNARDPAWKSIFINPYVMEDIDENSTIHATDVFFDNIEPLQLSFDYWYMLSSGKTSMTIEKKWVNNITYQTTGKTTTGLITNGDDGLFPNFKVNFIYESTHNRTTGFAFAGTPTSDIQVTISSTTNAIQADIIANDSIDGLDEYSPNDATSLFINSSQIFAGKFGLQYFVIDGISVYTQTSGPSTVSTTVSQPTTTTTTVQTTTTTTATATTTTVGISVYPRTIRSSTVSTTTPTVQTTTSDSSNPRMFYLIHFALLYLLTML